MIKRIHIWDFDGTLVDSSHRYRIKDNGKIDLEHWIANEHKVFEDTVISHTADKFRQLRDSAADYVIIATARIWCDLSQQFVKTHDLEPQAVYARRDRDDTRGGAALKIQAVKRLMNLKQFAGVETIHVYEDNKAYLRDICQAFDGIAHFIPSNQGH